MNFEWKMPKNKKQTFNDKIHNLACFEIVLNIFRMKSSSGKDVDDELDALCGFAFECMFGDIDRKDRELFMSIMDLKDKKVEKFRAKLLKSMGIPGNIMDSPEIGEA